MKMMYGHVDRMSPTRRREVRERAEDIKSRIEAL
jgi:hypothetical protein